MDVQIKKIQGMRLAAVRHVGPYEECNKAWDTLCGWAVPKGLLGPDTVYVGIGHDNPELIPAEKLRYDACISVGDDFMAETPVMESSIPPGQYATMIHEGPYEGLKDSWHKLIMEWLPESGREFREGPCFEIYLNDPDSTLPEKLKTELHIPVK